MSKIKKYKDFDGKDNLSKDIIILSKDENGNFEKIDEPVNILQITGIVTDKEDLKKIEEAFTLDTSVVVKDVKRGDILYLTCLLEKTSSSARNAQNWGILKVRVVEYYYGLNKLNTLIKNK
ncbi:hypothetical protein [Trichloromonas sp.]|uniref:hypothetical protein n=1 Tax=Trichloromonas sp. TaxID=3069249 RepID=UPI002A3A5BF7|nr:hypothetical protein [Trichloromonas sp.]